MKIRLLQKNDIGAASKIVGMNYSKKFERASKEEITAMFQRGPVPPMYFVAEEKGEVIGFAGYIQSWMDYYIYQIFWVNVHPQYKRKGIGKKLVGKLISEIKKKRNAKLILLTANSAVGNERYYSQNFGFKTIQRFDNKREHLMVLSLEK
ncbi:MAG TPA: GNAT family N-acetyltransferase [Candidatus Paceibacterota bacterium]|nr:GNAT family N-acetyltransferase [Candidatus Paceibacterota bacterium]